MKTFALPLVVAIAGVVAQDINSLPECERNCINNVLGIAPSLGCPATNNGQPEAACLCGKEAFAYAVRDCSSESCPEGTSIQPVAEYGVQYCSSAQASASGSSFAALGVFSSAASGASGGASSATETSSSASSSETRKPITTEPVVSTITSGSTTQETTVGSTTLFEGDNTTSSVESGSATTTRPVVSTVSESSTTRETTVGSTTESSMPSSSSKAAGATMAPLRMVPAFRGQQGGEDVGGWAVQAVGWTVGVVGLVQLMW